MATTKSYITEKYEELCNFLEKDTVGAELAIYGTSSLMLMAAFARRKPVYLVRQFRKPEHIPERIISERIMHTGQIRGIQQRDQDTLLLIKHRPWLPLFFTSRDRLLPVKLPGVRVNANGYSWLQNCLVGKEATFIPLNKSKDYVVCQLCLVHPPKGKGSNKLLDISETLLKLRFAKYAQDAATAQIKRNAKYYKHLERVESTTETKESWLAWAARHPLVWKLYNELKVSTLPKQKLLPELVR